MKKYKLVFLLLFVFLITGCDGSYKIEIYKDKVNEESYVWYKNDELNGINPYDKTLEIARKYEDNGDFLTHDSKKDITKSGYTGFKITRKYSSIDEFKSESRILGSCYLATNLSNHTEYITLRTTQEFTCYDMVEEFENIEIAVKTNHKVKEHNADKKKGNTYYWYINRDNYKNKPISIKMSKDDYVWNYDNEVFKRLGLIILVIGGTLMLVYVCYNVYNKKQQDINKI